MTTETEAEVIERIAKPVGPVTCVSVSMACFVAMANELSHLRAQRDELQRRMSEMVEENRRLRGAT